LQLVWITLLQMVLLKISFRYLGSHFYELGVTYNTRILPEGNLLHVKYGLSLQYNNLRATDNRNFVVSGNQTNWRNINKILVSKMSIYFSATRIWF
jgi:hypothetical protein